jgi:hypothetical protein
MEILLSHLTLITFSVVIIDCRKGKVAELPGILLPAEMFFLCFESNKECRMSYNDRGGNINQQN